MLELMITVFIAGLLVTIGIPSFAGLIRDSRMTAIANDFLTSVNYARSEAITRNEEIVLNSRFHRFWGAHGWKVFVDVSGARETLKIHKGLPSGYTLNGNGIGFIRYKPDGLATGARTIFLCLNDNPSTARAIVINAVGRARIKRKGVIQC